MPKPSSIRPFGSLHSPSPQSRVWKPMTNARPMAPTTSAVAGTAQSSAAARRTGLVQEMARASTRLTTMITKNGHGASRPMAIVAKPVAATTRKRPSWDFRRTRNQRPMSAYQPTHFDPAASPIMTPTSGRTHQALRAQRPLQIGQNSA
jgi:hypothetical protein